MKRVIIESPFAAPTQDQREANVAYARRCMLDALRRGEAPYASHLLYTQVLDDAAETERALGIQAGFEWGRAAELTAVYFDLGISNGMRLGIAHAKMCGRPIEYRSLEGKVWSE